MDLGVIDGRDVVAVPDPTRGGGNQPSQGPSDALRVPASVLGEGFQGFPVGGLLQGQDRLSDGVFLDVDGQGGDPLGEAMKATASEGPSEGVEQGLPDGPGEFSFGHDASPVLEPGSHYLASSDQETLLFNTVRPLSCCTVFRGNYCLAYFLSVLERCQDTTRGEPAGTAAFPPGENASGVMACRGNRRGDCSTSRRTSKVRQWKRKTGLPRLRWPNECGRGRWRSSWVRPGWSAANRCSRGRCVPGESCPR